MKIIIIRHADPDYENDSLTPKGWREAVYLRELLQEQELTHVYVSPLGRARATAAAALEGRGIEPIVCEWLREFDAPIHRPDVTDKKMITWDWLPQDWATEPVFYDHRDWLSHPVMTESDVKAACDWVTGSFDELLASHGYERDGHLYRVRRPNRDTLVFFCHFGVESVLLGRLMDISPMVLWHHLCAAPSSFTTLVTEERREGIALFRMTGFGEIAHLRAHGEEPSFQARFCETFDCTDERHD
jgi:probable phosphoglycerate mutase